MLTFMTSRPVGFADGGSIMPGFLGTLLERYQDHLERQRNRPFLEAAMAACALVSIADGDVSLSERIKVDQILETLEALKIFNPHEGVDVFNDFVDGIRKSPRQGRERAIETLIDVAQNPEDARLLIRLCCAVSEADGEMALSDQIEIVSLCSLMGVQPDACGLYIDDEPAKALGLLDDRPKQGEGTRTAGTKRNI